MMNMLLGGLLVLGSLTACGGDDSTDTPPTPPEKVVTSVKVDYSATVSQQLLDVATVTVRYIGENGQIQPTLKGAVNEGEYTLSANGQATYSWLDQDGQQLKAGATEKTPDMEAVFYADGLGQYLGAITANCQLARAFAKDFSVSDTTVAWGGNAGDDSTQGTGISDEGATEDNR